MHKLPMFVGVLASKMKPKTILDAARRFLNSPTARRMGETFRRRILEAIHQGAIEVLFDLMTSLPPRPRTRQREDTR